MDFNDTAEEAAFREEVQVWLAANIPSKAELEGQDFMAQCKFWQKRKYDDGWACISWPKEYGGRGATSIEQVIWNQEEAKFDLPGGVFGIGQGMAAPTMMTYADDAAKERYLPKSLASDCEFSAKELAEAMNTHLKAGNIAVDQKTSRSPKGLRVKKTPFETGTQYDE